MIEIDDFPPVTFKIGNSATKSDRDWLKKKKEYYEKEWSKNGTKMLRKIEDSCGTSFPDTSKQEGIVVLLYKKMPENQINGLLNDENPLEVSLFLGKTDTNNTLKELLVRMLVYSFIQQQYEFHFRMREQTLFEDILADELVALKVSFMVMGKKLGRANCTIALEQAIAQTVFRLSKKQAQNKLVDLTYNFFQETLVKSKRQKIDILTSREELIAKLLELLPKTVNSE